MTEADPVPFPSLAWFAKLGERMNADRARHEHLGYVDCVVEFAVRDQNAPGSWLRAQVTFEEFSVVDVRERRGPADAGRADFTLEADLEAWREMIESIARGKGRPALDQTLNYLSHFDSPFRVFAADPLKRDLYFRYNQSLQEFVNASADIVTKFAGRA
jgi:hypothetical protein